MPYRVVFCFLAAGALANSPIGLGAQSGSTVAPLRSDSAPHRLVFDTSRVRPARLTYRTSLTKDSVVSIGADMRVQITEVLYVGTPGWLLAQSGGQGVTEMADSLILARADLRPLHWIATRGLARLAAEFTLDSIFGAMSSPLGRQNIILRNRPDLLVSAAAVDVLLAALPLAGGWRDSAMVLVVDVGGATTVPAWLSVEGEERVIVPAGQYDCWIVSLETERGAAQYWVAKEAQLVVRSEQPLPQLGGAVLARELASAEMPAVLPPGTSPR